MKNLIIGASHHIEGITNQKLKDSPLLFNTSIRAFDFALNAKSRSNIELIMEMLAQIESLDIPVLRKVIAYPSTLESLISFVKELHNYRIPLDALPKDTKLSCELFEVIRVIYDLVEKPSLPNHTHISYYVDSLPHDQNFYLQSSSAQAVVLPSSEPDTIRLHHALNIRHEIEATLQELIKNNIQDATIALPNLKKNLPLVESILKRYGLPCTLEDRSAHLAKVQFLTLLEFSHKKNLETLKAVLAANALNLYYANDILYYINHFELSFDLCLAPFDHAKDPNSKQLIRLQERIQSEVLILQNVIHNFLATPYLDAIRYAYSLISENKRLNTVTIHAFIREYMHLFDEKSHEYLIYFIEKLSIPTTNPTKYKFVDLLNMPFEPVENLYVLNLNGSNFPSISNRTGLIDEQYLSKIEGYPSPEVRNKYALVQQRRFLKMSKHLILSHSVTNYEGKGQELSYPIAVFTKHLDISSNPWTMEQVVYRKKTNHRLTPEIARSLYLNNGKIVGSVSSFERYTLSPLDFFIESGLKLREPELPTFDTRILGTLNHAIVENIGQPFEPLWDKLYLSFPKHSLVLEAIRKRDDVLMKKNCDLLERVDASSTFTTMSREKYFVSHAIHPNIELRGIIDRVDYTDNHVIVIDYKSSSQSLSGPKILSGQQLQLLTYAVIAPSLFNKEVMGVFYYGFNMPNIKRNSLTYKAKDGIVEIDTDIEALWIKNKQLSGWFFSKPSDEFNDDKYFKSLRQVRDGSFSVGTPYDFLISRDNISSVYNDIQRNILEGILEVDELTFTLPMNTLFKEEKED